MVVCPPPLMSMVFLFIRVILVMPYALDMDGPCYTPLSNVTVVQFTQLTMSWFAPWEVSLQFDIASWEITAEHARVDIRTNGFWSGAQDEYFDVRVFHPNAPSNAVSISSAYKKHEDSKRQAYMDNTSERLSMKFLLFWFSQLLVGLVMKPLFSTRGWLIWFRANGISHTP